MKNGEQFDRSYLYQAHTKLLMLKSNLKKKKLHSVRESALVRGGRIMNFTFDSIWLMIIYSRLREKTFL